MTVTLRGLVPDDAAALAETLVRNRDHLRPWDPERPEEYFSEAGQAAVLAQLAKEHEAGTTYPWAILVDGEFAGRITLSNTVRGPLMSANVGYWVDGALTGRGVASAALAAVIPLAFGEIGLHRLEAGTLMHNVGSQRVLERNGFEQIGLARKFLRIAGEWQDHLLFQLINDDWTP